MTIGVYEDEVHEMTLVTMRVLLPTPKVWHSKLVYRLIEASAGLASLGKIWSAFTKLAIRNTNTHSSLYS